MDWSLDNLTPDERERVEHGLGHYGQFFLIIVPRLIEEPPPKPEPYAPIDLMDNPHCPRQIKRGPFDPLGDKIPIRE